MKPFNKEAALRGDVVCTRKGFAVRDLHELSEPLLGGQTWIGVVTRKGGHELAYTWLPDGKRFRSSPSGIDLMMATTPHALWVRPHRQKHTGEILLMTSSMKDAWPNDLDWVGEPHCWEIEE